MSNEPTTLGERYLLESPIASGGMATVWRARDDVLARRVAIKMLHPHLAQDDAFLERFRREALAAARLSHPHIVSIYDTGQELDAEGVARHYIVMEHCGRGTLADMLGRAGPVTPDQAVAVAGTICDALGYAHKSGVVHRDIKPANVLVCDDGSLKVADFGIAKAAFATGDVTTTGSILGTVTYVAPEQVTGLEPDARSDIYSLGVLLYELLAGHPPFRAESQLAIAMKHQRAAPPPLRSVRVGIPRALEAGVMRALEKDPGDRYQSVEDMRAALQGRSPARPGSTAIFEAPRPPTREPVPSQTGPPPGSSESRGLIPVIALVVAAVALAFFVPSLLTASDGDGAPPGPTPSTSNASSPRALVVEEVRDFDPYGGDREHPEEAPLATDADPSTAWRTSTYETSLADQKPGVGLLLDLGAGEDVGRVEVTSPTPGYSFELRAGDEVAGDESGFEVVDEVSDASSTSTVEPDLAARYWLLWITSLPGGEGGSARIAEVEFFGS
ncbi:hypothetical protein BH24ACT26_BH24ACT26_00390 [soil metagenome]